MVRILFLILLALGGLPGTALAGLSGGTLVRDGAERSCRLCLPDGLSRFPGPRPLVLVLHGGGGSAREVQQSTRGRFDELAEAHGFIVVYPDAIGRVWDTGSGKISAGLRPRRDGDGFLKALIATVGREHPVDRARVFATGATATACYRPRRRWRPSPGATAARARQRQGSAASSTGALPAAPRRPGS